jgi:hypothetical protein
VNFRVKTKVWTLVTVLGNGFVESTVL